MPWLATAVPLITSGAQLLSSASEKRQGEEKAKELKDERPKIKKDFGADANLALLKSEVANGMSARAEQAYKDINQGNFSATLSSLLKGGGDVNSIGDIYGNSQEGALKLAILKDNMRSNQIKAMIDQSNYVDQRNYVTPFQVNEYAPFQDKSAALGIARGQAAKQGNDALNSLASALMQYGQNEQEQKLFNLKSNNTTTGKTPSVNSGFDTSYLEPVQKTYVPTSANSISDNISVNPTFKPTSVDQVVTTSKRPDFLSNDSDYDQWKNIWNEVSFKKY